MITLKDYIISQFYEMKREIPAAIEGLSVDDLQSFEPAGHWPIAWIVLHCCGIIDSFIYKHITGKALLVHEVDRIAYPFKIEPNPGDKYPDLEELINRWSKLLDASIEQLSLLDEENFQESFYNHNESIAESCLRVINHTNTHLRNIWCILGEKRCDSKWAEQGKWLDN